MIRNGGGPTLPAQKKILGWSPKVPLDKGLLQTIAYFKRQGLIAGFA